MLTGRRVFMCKSQPRQELSTGSSDVAVGLVGSGAARQVLMAPLNMEVNLDGC